MLFVPIKRLFSCRLASHSGWMAMSGFVQSVVSFLANLVLVRYIDPAGFGQFAVTLASITLVMAVASLRIGTQIIRTKDQAFDDEKRVLYFNAILQELLVAGGIALCVLYIGGLLNVWSAVLLVAVLVSQFADNNKVFFERDMPYKKLSVLEAGVNGSGHFLSVFIVLLGGHVAALYVRELFYGFTTLLWLRKVGGFRWYRLRLLTRQEWKSIFQNIKGLWLDAMLENSFSRIVLLLAGYVGGEKGAGYLFQAYRLAGVPHQLLGPLAGRISFNWFSRQDSYAKRYAGLQSLIVYMSLPLVFAVVATYLYADRLVPFLFGSAWSQAGQLLVSLTGFMMFLSLFELLKGFVIASYQTRSLIAMRLTQYLGIGIVTVPLVFSGGMLTESELGSGVSVAYALAFTAGLWLVHSYGKRSGL